MNRNIRKINRDLRQLHDIYLARYDPQVQTCIPITDPVCPDVKHFLPLPYKNPARYGKIARFLMKTKNAQLISFSELTQGIQSYVSDKLDFSAFRHLYDEMSTDERMVLNNVLKFMADLALQLNEDNFEKIPLLNEGSNNSLSLSQRQAAILLANGFFCTFEDSIKRRGGAYNTFSFIQLFSIQTFKSVEKLKCIFAYFRSVYEKIPNGMITILRQKCPYIRFEDLNSPLSDVITEVDGFIENQIGEAHVDFANNFIGGGVLSHGAVQEEIRFIVAPETLISCLVCEQMNKNEAIIILGIQQYSNYKGYRNTFRYEPRQNDETFERTPLGHYPSCIIAIDAIRYSQPEKQFLRACIDREIRKAFTGFCIKVPNESQFIATGNWGCGAFNGNLELKFLIQFIAASAAGRDLHYFTFGEKKLAEKIGVLLQLLKENNVSFELLYSTLIGGGFKPSGDLIMRPFNYILEKTNCKSTSSMEVDDEIIQIGEEHAGTSVMESNGCVELKNDSDDSGRLKLEPIKTELKNIESEDISPNSEKNKIVERPTLKRQTTLDSYFSTTSPPNGNQKKISKK